jgi:hypothetical protein
MSCTGPAGARPLLQVVADYKRRAQCRPLVAQVRSPVMSLCRYGDTTRLWFSYVLCIRHATRARAPGGALKSNVPGQEDYTAPIGLRASKRIPHRMRSASPTRTTPDQRFRWSVPMWSPPAGIEPATLSLPWNHQEPLCGTPFPQLTSQGSVKVAIRPIRPIPRVTSPALHGGVDLGRRAEASLRHTQTFGAYLDFDGALAHVRPSGPRLSVLFQRSYAFSILAISRRCAAPNAAAAGPSAPLARSYPPGGVAAGSFSW